MAHIIPGAREVDPEAEAARLAAERFSPPPRPAPREFAGSVIIEWPAPANGAVPGYAISIADAASGEPITTARRLSAVHAAADNLVWAELEMFCTPDRKPILSGPIGSPPLYDVFPFHVAEMRVAGQ